MRTAIVNPTGRKVKTTKRLKKKKVKNYWPGQSARHSAAKKYGVAGPSYSPRYIPKNVSGKIKKSLKKHTNPTELALLSNPSKHKSQGGTMARKRRGGKKAHASKKRNPSRKSYAVKKHTMPKVAHKSHKKRRFRNPSGSAAYMDVAKLVGGAVIGNLAAKAIGNYGASFVGPMLPEGVQGYTKPGIQVLLGAGLFMFGDKVIKDDKIRVGVIAGVGVEAVNSVLQVVLPESMKSMLQDATGETPGISLAGITLSGPEEYAATISGVEIADGEIADGEIADGEIAGDPDSRVGDAPEFSGVESGEFSGGW